MASDNCGNYQKYLPELASEKKQSTAIEEKVIPKERKPVHIEKESLIQRNDLVKNILTKNEILRKCKKQTYRKETSVVMSVGDLGNSEVDYSDENEMLARSTAQRSTFDFNVIQLAVQPIECSNAPQQKRQKYSSPGVFNSVKEMSEVTSDFDTPPSKRQKFSLLSPRKIMPPIPPPSPITSDSASDSGYSSEPIVLTLEELIAHGISEDDEMGCMMDRYCDTDYNFACIT